MSRWSISNIFRPVTRDQFVTLSEQFKGAAEELLDAPCTLEVHAMAGIKLTSSFMLDEGDGRWMALQNKNQTFFTADDPRKLTDEIWRGAAYVEVIVKPADPAQAPDSAFGIAEFKGYLPKTASFYMQPDDADRVARDVITQQRLKWIGSGWDTNAHHFFHPLDIIKKQRSIYDYFVVSPR